MPEATRKESAEAYKQGPRVNMRYLALSLAKSLCKEAKGPQALEAAGDAATSLSMAHRCVGRKTLLLQTIAIIKHAIDSDDANVHSRNGLGMGQDDLVHEEVSLDHAEKVFGSWLPSYVQMAYADKEAAPTASMHSLLTFAEDVQNTVGRRGGLLGAFCRYTCGKIQQEPFKPSVSTSKRREQYSFPAESDPPAQDKLLVDQVRMPRQEIQTIMHLQQTHSIRSLSPLLLVAQLQKRLGQRLDSHHAFVEGLKTSRKQLRRMASSSISSLLLGHQDIGTFFYHLFTANEKDDLDLTSNDVAQIYMHMLQQILYTSEPSRFMHGDLYKSLMSKS